MGEFPHHIEEQIGARHQVVGIGVLGRVVADAEVRLREDHRGGADAGQHLRVVSGARRETAPGVTTLGDRVFDDGDHALVELDRFESGE